MLLPQELVIGITKRDDSRLCRSSPASRLQRRRPASLPPSVATADVESVVQINAAASQATALPASLPVDDAAFVCV